MKKFWFKSSRKSDNCPGMMVSTSSATRAVAIVTKYFNRNGFKGEPQMLSV